MRGKIGHLHAFKPLKKYWRAIPEIMIYIADSLSRDDARPSSAVADKDNGPNNGKTERAKPIKEAELNRKPFARVA